MADYRGLGFIGWAFGAVTLAVIATSGLVTASVLQADPASSVTLSAAAR
jgi:hypothetical protein